jgi:hypothetical protein
MLGPATVRRQHNDLNRFYGDSWHKAVNVSHLVTAIGLLEMAEEAERVGLVLTAQELETKAATYERKAFGGSK